MRALAVLLVGLGLACGGPTEPSPTLQFEGLVVFGIPTLPVTAEPLDGGIKVSGVIPTPTAEYTLAGHIRSAGGNRLVLDIIVERTQDGVPFPVQNYYQGRIGNLSRGDYDLEVFHTLHITDPQTSSVFHGVVHVP